METTTETRCGRCHRRLHAAASIADGYGRYCKARIRAAALTRALAGYTARQIEKARELITDRGLIPTSRRGVWRAVSSDGTTSYLVAANTDNCPAGLHGTLCYHTAAVRMVTA